MVNRFPQECRYCGATVPANGGTVEKVGRTWLASHLSCKKSGKPEVTEVRFSSGATITRNARGTCEDAPCCGCCTF